MALLKVICGAIIFIARLRFPPGKSLATILNSVVLGLDQKKLIGSWTALKLLHHHLFKKTFLV